MERRCLYNALSVIPQTFSFCSEKEKLSYLARWCENVKCRYPIAIQVDGHNIYVPCGHCAWCLRQKQTEWFFRLKVEAKNSKFKRFLTLTYDDQHVNQNLNEETGEMINTVFKPDVQKFIKAIRNDGFKVRYMITSEYGKLGRPHYHGVMFSDDRVPYQEFWSKGFVCDAPAKDGSFRYITKYMLKGSNVPDGADPNFMLCSRRPGLGHQFIYKGEPYILDRGGVKLVPGHYYKRNYLSSLDEKLRGIVVESKLEYLETSDPFGILYQRYIENGVGGTFENYLSMLYGQDFKKQIKINNG